MLTLGLRALTGGSAVLFEGLSAGSLGLSRLISSTSAIDAAAGAASKKPAATPAKGQKQPAKPVGPPKPLSAYQLFMKDALPRLKTSLPSLDQKQRMSKAAEMFRSLTERELQPYQAQYEKTKAAYETFRQKEKDARPKSGYNLFTVDRVPVLRAKLGHQTPITEVIKAVGAEWKALPDAQQQQWRDKAAKTKLP